VIWNDGGDRGDLRWVGTEDGYVGETNWSLLNATGDVPWNNLHFGVENGNAWVMAEVNTSIRPEWFYHPSEDGKVKTVPQLMDYYYHSIGRNGTMLLNFPIMPNGLIHPTDEKNGIEFAKAVKESFAVNLALNKKAKASNVRGKSVKFGAAMAVDGKKSTYWATDDNTKAASLTIDLGKPTLFNRFLAQEYIRLGQRVKAFTVEAFVDGKWKEVAKATTIGYKRILRFPAVKATQVRFNITDSKCNPVISNIGVYNAPVFLYAPVITRNQSGQVTINTNDIGPIFYYTLDDSTPTAKSNKYSGAFSADGKVEVKAISYDPTSGKSSPVSAEKFDISKRGWKLIGVSDDKAAAIIDGDPSSVWHQRDNKMPIDLVLDLGNKYNVSGFKYLPDQNRWSSGIITAFEFYVSDDNVNWKIVGQGEFSNIKNNPLLQIKKIAPVMARYIKLRALKNTSGDNVAGYAEMDVITE
jgi:alpha-L-fucosidase